MSTPTEWELVERCRRGSHAAFEPLVLRYQDRALGVARAALGDADEAADVVQDAFVRAFRTLDRLEERSPFGPWFWTILRNLCRDRLRSARGRRPARPVAELERLLWEPPAGTAALEREETAAALRAGLAELSPEHREVLVLKEWQELSYAEIAAMTGVSAGTVASRLHHARLALRKVLVARGFPLEGRNP